MLVNIFQLLFKKNKEWEGKVRQGGSNLFQNNGGE